MSLQPSINNNNKIVNVMLITNTKSKLIKLMNLQSFKKVYIKNNVKVLNKQQKIFKLTSISADQGRQ